MALINRLVPCGIDDWAHVLVPARLKRQQEHLAVLHSRALGVVRDPG